MAEEWLERTELLLGEEALIRLEKTTVAIIGLGGVGGYVCEALARAGIGRLILCDADVVAPSNINRQILSKSTNVGEAKATLAAKRVKQINPHCEVIARQLFFHEDTMEEIFKLNPEIVVDAIDSLNPKIVLLTTCLERKIPVVTAMGAALRIDPTKITINTIDKVTNDRLSAKIRKRLRHQGQGSALPALLAVYSNELPMLDGMGAADSSEEAATVRGRVRRPLGTISAVPAVEGMTIGAAVLAILLADICPEFKALLPNSYLKRLIRDDKVHL